jgi:hypothetical protein
MMLCPICQKEMIPDTEPRFWDDRCLECNIFFYSKEIIVDRRLLEDLYQVQHNLLPETDYYWFEEHDKFYTVSEMERIAKLKAFL